MREAEAMALLVMSRGVFYSRRDAALRAAGSALAVVQEPEAYARQLGEAGVSAVRRSAGQSERLLDALRRDGVGLLVLGGEGYPERLSQIRCPPHLLFVKGKASLEDDFPFAVVGTRRASRYGLEHTREIARELARSGVCVVSGLAVGIDAAAHQGALDADGRTVAILGGALDRFYPMENHALMERILESGGSVATEYPPGTPPGKYSFLERNRIIAGLALGVLVTEGGRRSGAQRTVREALDEGREVFALPGSVDSEGSTLPNSLIADGAHLITCARDILSALVIEPAGVQPEPGGQAGEAAEKAAPGKEERRRTGRGERPVTPKAEPKSLPEAPEDAQEAAVYAVLVEGEADFDTLCMRTGIAPDEMGALLMVMEMDGRIRALAGLRYELIG